MPSHVDFDSSTASLVLALGLLFSLVCYAFTNLSPGGMIVPGWLALTLVEWLDTVVVTGAAMVATYGAAKLLQRWSTAAELAAAGRDEIETLARQAKHGWAGRFTDRVTTALAADHFQPRDYLIRAKADTIRLTCAQLLLLRQQRRAWERRMGELLLGNQHRGRTKQPGDQPGPTVPGGEIYLSFPGLGDRLAARIAGEIGDAIGQFDTPNALQCYAGKAPVTRRSGSSIRGEHPPKGGNKQLKRAFFLAAFAALADPTSRTYYDRKRAEGKKHNAALICLARRRIDVLHAMLRTKTTYRLPEPTPNLAAA